MIPQSHYQKRRRQLLAAQGEPLLLLSGGLKSRNYPQNPFPYRADSTFLFFFAEPEPDSAALFDPGDGSVTLFLQERTAEDALWHGPVPSFEDMRAAHGVDRVVSFGRLAEVVRETVGGRALHSIAVADPAATALAASITGQELDHDRTDAQGDPAVIRAIAELRLRREPEELDEMRATAAVTREAHLAAMAHTRLGVHEQELAGHVQGTFSRSGCSAAYGTILSVRGEILHNVHQRHVLQDGDLVLLDAGAESASGYCSDVTRTWPAAGRFSPQAREIYDVVLAAESAAIDRVRPGVRYRDVHLTACRVIAEGLADLGLLKGEVDGLVESGAHALFFPHGVGHLLGLDVHDMEAFGDAVSYAEGRRRSEEFGLAYLRLDLDLEPGICATIEPGVYFVPAILHESGFRERFAPQVDFDRAEQYLRMNAGRGFGGVRIEDDVLTTAGDPEILTPGIPKAPDELEAAVGTA